MLTKNNMLVSIINRWLQSASQIRFGLCVKTLWVLQVLLSQTCKWNQNCCHWCACAWGLRAAAFPSYSQSDIFLLNLMVETSGAYKSLEFFSFLCRMYFDTSSTIQNIKISPFLFQCKFIILTIYRVCTCTGTTRLLPLHVNSKINCMGL